MAPSTTQAYIDALGDRVDKNFDELKVMFSMFDKRLRDVEQQEASCQPLLESKIDAAWKKIDKHEADLLSLQKTVTDLTFVVYRMEGISKWILGVITSLIVAILIAVMTGKVSIVFGS